MGKNIIKNQQGTTLLELIIALALFTTAMLAATQIFNMMIKVQQTALVSQNVQSDMRYLTEVITKEMRMAEVDKNGDCITKDKVYSTAGETLEFENIDGQCITYEVDNGGFQITRNGETKTITTDDTVIKDVDFYQYGEVPASQPQITMNLDIELNKKAREENKKINLQTTISTRHYE